MFLSRVTVACSFKKLSSAVWLALGSGYDRLSMSVSLRYQNKCCGVMVVWPSGCQVPGSAASTILNKGVGARWGDLQDGWNWNDL